ncbi:hypothetical protein NUSPORA_00634 [Nucleospora cyclopteri]
MINKQNSLGTLLFCCCIYKTRSSFTPAERLLIPFLFDRLQYNQAIDSKFLYWTFFQIILYDHFSITAPIETYVFFEMDFVPLLISQFDLILTLKLGIALVLTFIVEMAILKSRFVNLKRKILHVFGFVSVKIALKDGHLSILIILYLQIVLFVFLWLLNCCFLRHYQQFLKSKRDIGQFIFSHIFISCSLLFPYFYLNSRFYLQSVILVCVLDMMASFGPIVPFNLSFLDVFNLKSTKYFNFITHSKKTINGFLLGVFSSCIINWFIFGDFDFVFYFGAGCFEFSINSVNDNIYLPLYSITYSKLINKL